MPSSCQVLELIGSGDGASAIQGGQHGMAALLPITRLRSHLHAHVHVSSKLCVHAYVGRVTSECAAPEILKLQPAGLRADIWSFGYCMWQLLSGNALYRQEAIARVGAMEMQARLRRTVQQVRQKMPSKQGVHTCGVASLVTHRQLSAGA